MTILLHIRSSGPPFCLARHWLGLDPSAMLACSKWDMTGYVVPTYGCVFPLAATAAKSLQSCLTPCDPIRRQPTRLPRPWDSPDKNTGVGCHFLLQCIKVKSESEVAQSCPTPSDPMDCSLPGSSIHGIFQARVLEWGAIAFSRVAMYHPLNHPGWNLSLISVV